MSLFSYRVIVKGGKEENGRITAKTEQKARDAVAKEKSVVSWLSIVEVAPPRPALKLEPRKTKPLSKLGRILYLQSGKCFFCGQLLDEKEASIEHLNPKSKGGTSTEDNEVVCHSSLNATFGNMDLKNKFEFTLRSAGAFKCPK